MSTLRGIKGAIAEYINLEYIMKESRIAVTIAIKEYFRLIDNNNNKLTNNLNLVLNNRNISTNDITYCLNYTKSVNDILGNSICHMLLKLTKTQRLKVTWSIK